VRALAHTKNKQCLLQKAPYGVCNVEEGCQNKRAGANRRKAAYGYLRDSDASTGGKLEPVIVMLSSGRIMIGRWFRAILLGFLAISHRVATRQWRFHNLTSGPSAPITGSVFGSFTSGIVVNALA
jgi:hypothetical protein